jgi:hypothetical protein
MEVQSMKRSSIALLVAGLCLLATSAMGGVGGAVLKTHTLPIRHAQGNALTSQTYNQVVQGYIDSTFAGHGSARTDTTAAFSLLPVFQVPGFYSSIAATDTNYAFTFRIYPAPNQAGQGTTAGFDTVYVTPQYSLGGDTWVSSNLVLIVVEPTSADCAFRIFHTAQVQTQAPTASAFWGWNKCRFILQSDYTGYFGTAVDYFENLGQAQNEATAP